MNILGWILWDDELNRPYKVTRSEGRWFERLEPVKVYSSNKRAQNYADQNDCSVKPVYVEED